MLIIIKVNACDCDPANPILQFYDSEYVFEGEIVSKVYAEDIETYTITFEVDKHYKDGEKPEELNFIMKSEEFHTGESTSCDWSANVGERWLVFAFLDENELLSFSYYCSNSRRLDYRSIDEDLQKILDNGNDFVLGDYIYHREVGFTYTTPITNIDSIVKQIKTKYKKSHFVNIKFCIDKKGNLQFVAGSKQYPLIYDSIFKLAKGFVREKYKPSSEFEKEALEIAKKIKKWEVKYHKKTRIPVAYIRYVIFQYDKENHKWSYEL